MGMKELIDSIIDRMEEIERQKNLLSVYDVKFFTFIPELEVRYGFFEICDSLGVKHSEIPCNLIKHRKLETVYRGVRIWSYVPKDDC